MVVVKSGFLFLLFLHLIRSGFVESLYECVFSGKDFVTFGKDIVDGRMPSRYTLLATNDQGHIDSFRIEVICDERKNIQHKSIVVTALKKKVQLNPSNVTVDQILQKRDVSIIIPPLRVDLIQDRGLKTVNLNTGISILYTPPDSGKIIIFDDYTGTHNLSGACGNPWKAGRVDHDDIRRRLFQFLNEKPKKTIMSKKLTKPKPPTGHGSPRLTKLKPKFVPSVNGHSNRHHFSRQKNGAHNPLMNPKKPDDRFQDQRIYPNCYLGGYWQMNGSIWMAADCSRIFTCTNSFVAHSKSPGCSVFADCVKVRQSGTCRCRPGFIGNGFTCVYIQDKVAPQHRPGNAPRNNFATHITPVVPVGRLITPVRNNFKARPTYSDSGNRGRKPSHINPFDSRNRYNFKKMRPLKRRPFLRSQKPRKEKLARQKPNNSFRLNVPPKFLNVRRKPVGSVMVNDRKPIRKRPHTKTALKNRQLPRTHPGIMRSRQKPKPKIFSRPSKTFNRNNKGRQQDKNPGKVIKPSKKDRNPFRKNRGYPRALEKNRGILPKKNLFPVRTRFFPIPVTVHVPLNHKPILGKGRKIPSRKIPNYSRPFGKGKPKTNPAASPNNHEKLLRKIIKDLINPKKQRNPIKSPNHFRKGSRKHPTNSKNPIHRPLTNPKRTDLGSKQPYRKNLQNHKRPFLKLRRYKKPTKSDIKRVTEIIRSLNKKVTNPSLPTESSRYTTMNVRESTFLASRAGLTSTVINFIDSVSKKTGDGHFLYSSSVTPDIRQIGTLPTLYTSLEPPLFNVDKPALPNENNVKSIMLKKPLVDSNSVNNKRRYPTADGTIDGLLVEPPIKWPMNRLNIKPVYRYPKTLPKYSYKKRNQKLQNRPSINKLKPNTRSKVDSSVRKCKSNGLGCSKINTTGFTGKDRRFFYPFSFSTNPTSFQESTQAANVLYSTDGALTTMIGSKFTTNDVTGNWKLQSPKTNPGMRTKEPGENLRLQLPSVLEKPGQTEPNHEECNDEENASSGLRYKIMKKIKHSVEEIQT